MARDTLCRAVSVDEHEEWLERPFSQPLFQAGFILFQKSLKQPSQWSFSCQVINRLVWSDPYRREQWYVEYVLLVILKESGFLEPELDTDQLMTFQEVQNVISPPGLEIGLRSAFCLLAFTAAAEEFLHWY